MKFEISPSIIFLSQKEWGRRKLAGGIPNRNIRMGIDKGIYIREMLKGPPDSWAVCPAVIEPLGRWHFLGLTLKDISFNISLIDLTDKYNSFPLSFIPVWDNESHLDMVEVAAQ